MTEPTQPEGGAEQVNQELPTPKFTEASPVSATSSVDTKAIAREVAEILKPDFEKAAQSTKDKRFAAIEKRLGLSNLAELEEMGVQIPENIKTEYRFRQLESERAKPESSSQATTSQGSGATLTAQDVSEVVKRFNLDANDAEVIEKLRGTYRNRDHFEATLANVAFARINKPQPSPAASTSLQSTPAPAGDETVELQNKLNTLLQDPIKNHKEIAEVKKKIGW